MEKSGTAVPIPGYRSGRIQEAARLFEYVGYIEDYFEDVFRATSSDVACQPHPDECEALARTSFAWNARNESNQLFYAASGRLLDLGVTLRLLEHQWKPLQTQGDNTVLNVLADPPAVSGMILHDALEVITGWVNAFGVQIEKSLQGVWCSEHATGEAAQLVATLLGGYRLSTIYRNPSHFHRTIHHLRRRYLTRGPVMLAS